MKVMIILNEDGKKETIFLNAESLPSIIGDLDYVTRNGNTLDEIKNVCSNYGGQKEDWAEFDKDSASEIQFALESNASYLFSLCQTKKTFDMYMCKIPSFLN